MGILSDDIFLKEIDRFGVSINDDISRVPTADRISNIADKLNKVPSKIPSLRDRLEEVPPARPADHPDAISINEESIDTEPKEKSSGLDLRSMELPNRDDTTEDISPDSRAIIHQLEKGRPKGRANRTHEEREIIAGEALIHGNDWASKKYGIAPSTISAYTHGATSSASYTDPDDDLMRSVSSQRLKIASVAHGKLSDALNHITPDKLASANLRTIASVAQSMSAIVKNMEPEVRQENSQNIQFTFYAPKTKQEDNFDVIDMQDE
jgi:hypothetical protein